jgi:formylglycine-generating enzyme required for sulfatase activity
MVKIPAGPFIMGSDSGASDERPAHSVHLNGFWIDRHEVSTAEWNAYAQAMNLPIRSAPDDHPIISVGWPDALAYCQWVGKRLPTEAEWEYAARGGDGIYRKYPWGNEDPDADGIWWANYRPDAGPAADSHRYTAPVGSYPDGVSPFGIMDMAGNAEEWVHDWWGVNYYRLSDGAQDPQGPASGRNGNKVIKGGSFSSDKYHVRIATRLYGAPHVKTEKQGFRCAMDL